MIDIHCHILPAIDDGPDDLREMLEMLSLAARDSITHIVATPHYRQGESPTTRDIEEKIMRVRKEMVKSSQLSKLLGGADIRLTCELMEDIQENEILAINSPRYFLLEPPDLIPPHLDDFLLTQNSRVMSLS